MSADLVSVVMARVREQEELARRRPVVRKTHCKNGHEFTNANTILSPEGWRKCRACERSRRRIRPHARRARHMTVQCPGCGNRRFLSERQALRVKVGEATGRCELCVNAPHIRVTDSLCNWWLARYSLSEIREMAASISWLLGEEHRAR